MPEFNYIGDIQIFDVLHSFALIVQRSTALEFQYILVSSYDGDQLIAMGFRLLEKIYMPRMYDIKCSKSHYFRHAPWFTY
jgi:hypothetical protein